jgi:hypothetical protein
LEGQQTFPDRALAQLGANRRVALSLPFFFAIAQTDLILTVPPQIGTDYCSDSSYTRREMTREIKAFPYSWLGIRSSLLNLRMHGFANNYGWLPEPDAPFLWKPDYEEMWGNS